MQWFTPESIHGLDLLYWYHSLPQFAPLTLKSNESKATKITSRQNVLSAALEHFAKKYKNKRPDYVFAPDEGKGKYSSMYVPSSVYVPVKLIAQRDRQPIEHTVETAIKDFLMDVLTQEMRDYHTEVMTRGLELLHKSEARRTT